MRKLLAFLVVVGLLVACGTDNGPTPDDAGTDARRLDAGVDAPYWDGDPGDVADSSYVIPPCDPNGDAGDTCGAAKKCCPIGNNGPDGGPNYGCVFLKVGTDTCPTPTPGP